MHKQDHGCCVSGEARAHCIGAGARQFAIKASFSLLLTAICPAALFAANDTTPANSTPKLPSPPAVAVHPEASTTGFTLAASPGIIQLLPGGVGQALRVSAIADAGFKGTVTIKVANLPAGLKATPASLEVTPGSDKSIELSALSTAKVGRYTIEFTGTSGTLTKSSPVTVEVSTTTTTATLSTLLFDFGNNLTNYKMVQTVVVVTNTGTGTLALNPALTGNTSYSIVATKSCGTQLAAGKSCDMVLRYLPTTASYPKAQTATLAMHFGNAAAGVPGSVAITGVAAALKPGTVSPTNNPQVGLYSITLPFPGKVKVGFGLTTAYGRNTWEQYGDENNTTINIFVAGMLAKSTYHMTAYVLLDNGVEQTDGDHTFTTGAVPAQMVLSNLTATTTAGMTPAPGVEMTNPLRGLDVVDLAGNVIWTYSVPTPTDDYLDGVKMLPDGDILVTVGPLSNAPLGGAIPLDTLDEIREINLAGDTVRELSVADLNASLATAPSSCKECQGVTLLSFHHDITPLPNGHWLILSNSIRKLSASSTPPLTNLPAQKVLGDIIIDVDENMQPVWAWNEFNHLDANRHPFMFPDWTHTNAVIYSPDDGNILVSIRHQNWILKIDYRNGGGTGDILWHLGDAGDFKLLGGTAPQDWQYAQHDPGYFSPNTSGVFSLGVMDNGDDRIYPASNICTTSKTPPASCTYSTVPVFKIDEVNKTATLTFHQKMPISIYSNFGGNTDELPNGDVEYDLCGIGTTSLVREVTQDSEMKTVWSMDWPQGNFYRAFRIPSLYPGVQW
jgi:arylsulfate sulfotransferase